MNKRIWKMNMALDTDEVENFNTAYAALKNGYYQFDGVDVKYRYNWKTLKFYEEDWEVEGDPDAMYELAKKVIERNLSKITYSPQDNKHPEAAFEILDDAFFYVKIMMGLKFYRDIDGNRKTCKSWEEPCIVIHRHTGEEI